MRNSSTQVRVEALKCNVDEPHVQLQLDSYGKPELVSVFHKGLTEKQILKLARRQTYWRTGFKITYQSIKLN